MEEQKSKGDDRYLSSINTERHKYHAFERFIKNYYNAMLRGLMAKQVTQLYERGVLYTSLIAVDSTPIAASTKQNKPKSFAKKKFNKDRQPKIDKDC